MIKNPGKYEVAYALTRDDNYGVYYAKGKVDPGEVWQYTATPPESFFAPIISGAQRLASGNTLVTSGPTGHFFEVTSDGQTVWSYDVTDTAGTTGYMVFRAVRYEPGFEGLSQNLLAPEGLLRIPAVTTGTRPTVSRY